MRAIYQKINLLLLVAGMLPGCRSEQAALHYRVSGRVGERDTVAAAPVLPPAPPVVTAKPEALPQRKPLAPPPRPRPLRPRARPIAPVAAPARQPVWRKPLRTLRRHSETAYLDPAQHNGIVVAAVGLGLILLSILLLLAIGSNASLGPILLLFVLYYTAFIVFAVGLVLLLVATFLKLLYRR